MLRELEIENLAVISHAAMEFSPHLNVFTGETGAGKSILVSGIRAVLGGRVTKDLVRTGCQKATITALFTNLEPPVCACLDALGLDHSDDTLLLSREILAQGGSSARINGHPAAASMLREIGETLLNIHGQHDSQALLSPDRHLQILDDFGGDETRLQTYQEAFHSLQETARNQSRLQQMEREKGARRIFLERFLQETTPLQLQKGEEDTLERELILLQNAAGLKQSLRGAAQNLADENGDVSAVGLTETARGLLSEYAPMQEDFKELCRRLQVVLIELKDIAADCRTLQKNVELDPSRLDEVQRRLQEIHRLVREYSCADRDNLVDEQERAKAELTRLNSNTVALEKLKAERAQKLAKVSAEAKSLSAYRRETLSRFEKAVTAELTFLDMPDVVIKGNLVTGKLTKNGMDNLEFLISPNRGESLRPLAKIASGGELSRIMLALKCVIADRDQVPTLIFDEIDAGVSGKAAQKIGRKLQELGRTHQVLCVTHLSQIAVMAERHLMIEKEAVDDRTEARVIPLDDAGRVREIARIMGGDNPSGLILQSAKEELSRWKPEGKIS